jgi:cyclase
MPKPLRIIARLDIKGDKLIKGMHLEGLRVIGNPQNFASMYYEDGIDEIIYLDAVASLYSRSHLAELVSDAAKNIFVPITVGGGIRSVADVDRLLRAGADKVAINTAVMKHPSLIDQIANRYGSQCMVLYVEAKQVALNMWEAYIENGREKTGKDVIEWISEAVQRGAGEILLTSVDREGTRKGFDINLTRSVSQCVNVPIIASGGMGCIQDLLDVAVDGLADAVAMADVLHYKRLKISEIKKEAHEKGLKVRLL